MKREELISILEELAEKDLSNGADIYDHPCSVAIREIKELEAAMQEFVAQTPLACNPTLVRWHNKFKQLLEEE